MKYKAFHKLSYGLYVIASELEGKMAGYIGNTAFQVTSEPSKIAISCHKENHSSNIILERKAFSVSVLKKESDTGLIGRFGFMSSSEMDKFDGVEFTKAVSGVPIVLDSSLAWFDCKVVDSFDVGSHILIIGEVLESEILSDEEPLTYDYYRDKFKMLAPKNSPTYLDKEKLEAEPEQSDSSEVKKEAETLAEDNLDSFTCTICGFQYNPEEGDPTMGIPPGTPFADLPEDYKCPICNAGKEYFKES